VISGTDPGLSGSAVEFPVALEGDVTLQQGALPLPAPLPGSGYWMGAYDVSEDLFLYVVREIDDLTPNATYRARFCATVATDLHLGGFGQREYLKLGVSNHQPSRVVVDSDNGPFYVLDIDKGRLPGVGGSSAFSAGQLGRPEDEGPGWALVTKEADESLTVTADALGRVWLLAGVESTFGGTVEFYWDELEIELSPLH
jgi:hypothetical protein